MTADQHSRLARFLELLNAAVQETQIYPDSYSGALNDGPGGPMLDVVLDWNHKTGVYGTRRWD